MRYGEMKKEDSQDQIPPECCLPMEIEMEFSYFYYQIKGERKNDKGNR